MEPRYSTKKNDKLHVNYKSYERLIKDLRKDFWDVVFGGISYKEAAQMDTDTLLEARAALKKINDEINKRTGGGR